MRVAPALRVSAALVLAAGALLAPAVAQAICTTTSATNICVAHNGSVYTIDRGLGPVAQAPVPLARDVTITFEMDPASTALASHPFYITDSPTGGGAGTKLTQPVSTGKVSFIATASTPSPIFYQCDIHQNMGGPINVSGAATDAGAGADASTGGADASVPAERDASSPATDAGADAGKSTVSSGGCSAAPVTGHGGAPALLGLAMAALAFVRARRGTASHLRRPAR